MNFSTVLLFILNELLLYAKTSLNLSLWRSSLRRWGKVPSILDADALCFGNVAHDSDFSYWNP